MKKPQVNPVRKSEFSNRVYFIGAGPGDPELLTLKAVNIIKKADLIIYAGSLVNKDILKFTKKNAKILNSASLTLPEILKSIVSAVKKRKIVARIHSGDPAIYSSLQEHIEYLEKKKIEYEIIPGVSSFLAASARIKRELTIPEVSQTVIITRFSGRTKVPKNEDLGKLAKHKATLIIFLSIEYIEKIVNKLERSYKKNTPVVVVYKATWDDEKIIRGDLNNIAKKVREENIRSTALLIIGDVLKAKVKKSKLYDKNFSHGYRK